MVVCFNYIYIIVDIWGFIDVVRLGNVGFYFF